MPERFDVIVVGGRCAGAPLAARLASAGLRVCVLDRARFPSEVPSTHMIHPNGVASLARLGLMEPMLATGAPPLVRGRFVLDDVDLDFTPQVAARFEAPWLCIRRSVLDPLLLEAAAEAGAEVRTQTPAVGLIRDSGTVRGVRTPAGDVTAALVIGADGPSSFVARAVGAGEYHVTPPGRLFLWTYFEGAAAPDGFAALGRVGEVAFLAMHTDGGLFMAGVALAMDEREAVMADLESRFTQALLGVTPIADIVRPARRVGPIRTMTRWHGFFRQATGPGWALVGDAGHLKDPTPAQGISDALRQGEHLATVIQDCLGGARDLTDGLGEWWQWRDGDARAMYWFANDMGSPAPGGGLVREMLRTLARQPNGTETMLRVLNHELEPSRIFGPAVGLKTLARLAATKPRSLPATFNELRTLSAEDRRRRRLSFGA